MTRTGEPKGAYMIVRNPEEVVNMLMGRIPHADIELDRARLSRLSFPARIATFVLVETDETSSLAKAVCLLEQD